MTNLYDELNRAKREERYELSGYTIAKQERDAWEHDRAERAKSPTYTHKDYEYDNVVSYEKGQREVAARNLYENAQTKRLEIESILDKLMPEKPEALENKENSEKTDKTETVDENEKIEITDQENNNIR